MFLKEFPRHPTFLKNIVGPFISKLRSVYYPNIPAGRLLYTSLDVIDLSGLRRQCLLAVCYGCCYVFVSRASRRCCSLSAAGRYYHSLSCLTVSCSLLLFILRSADGFTLNVTLAHLFSVARAVTRVR